MSYTPKYFAGFGKIYIGDRDPVTGKPKNLRWINDAATLRASIAVEKAEGTESWSGKNATAYSFIRSVKATLSITAKEYSPEALKLALQTGEKITPAGSVTGEVIGSGKAGDLLVLAFKNVSMLVITNAGAPLEAGVDYLVNTKTGSVELLKPFMNPLSASYEYGQSISYSALGVSESDKYVFFEGENRLTNEGAVFEAYKVRFSPTTDFSLIGDDAGTLELTAEILIDPTRPEDDQYFKTTIV